MSFYNTIISFGFRLLYNELAFTYDLVSWLVSLGHWRKWQTAALDHITGRDVLEIAHGPGHMLIPLHQRGFRVTACDLSVSMGQLARNRLRRARLQSAVPLIRCRIPHFPLAPQTFDTILSQFPTTYIIEQATLNQLHDLLRPNGRLVILPEGHLTGQTIIHQFIVWLFTITGQQAPATTNTLSATPQHQKPNLGIWQILHDNLHTAGFTKITIETLKFKGSEATLLIAHKKPSQSFDTLPPTA